MNARHDVPVDPVVGWAELPPVAQPPMGRRIVSALLGGLIVALICGVLTRFVFHVPIAEVNSQSVVAGVVGAFSSFFSGRGSKRNRSLSDQYRELAR